MPAAWKEQSYSGLTWSGKLPHPGNISNRRYEVQLSLVHRLRDSRGTIRIPGRNLQAGILRAQLQQEGRIFCRSLEARLIRSSIGSIGGRARLANSGHRMCVATASYVVAEFGQIIHCVVLDDLVEWRLPKNCIAVPKSSPMEIEGRDGAVISRSIHRPKDRL